MPFATRVWEDDDSHAVTLDYSTVVFDEQVILQALQSAYMVFTHPCHYTIDGDYIYGLMSTEDVQCGNFLSDKTKQQTFRDALFSKKRHREEGPNNGARNQVGPVKIVCDCARVGLTECVLGVLPLEELDIVLLFNSVEDHLTDSVTSDTFDGLSSSHKRWCFYWWYSVNIFKIKDGRKKLPACFLSAVRELYANEEESKPFITGFIGDEVANDSTCNAESIVIKEAIVICSTL